MSTCCAADSSPSRNCTFKLGRVLKTRNVSVALEGSNGWRKCRTALFFFPSRDVNINRTTLREGVAWIIVIS